MKTKGKLLAGIGAAATMVAGMVAGALPGAAAVNGASERPVAVAVLSPESSHRAGLEGRGWFVDLEIDFPGDLTSTGFTSLQLTGPGVHANAVPFPGSFSPGQDDRLPGLVVLVSGTTSVAPFSGPGTNVANLFNLTGVTDRSEDGTELWDTWIVGAPLFGTGRTTLRVAVVDDLNNDGIYNDAPSVVPDANSDGVIGGSDLEALGLASDIERVVFKISGAP